MVIRKLIIRVLAFLVPILLDAFCMGLKKWYWQKQRDKRRLNYRDYHELD